MHELPFHFGAAATSSLYAIVLEKIGKEGYEPDFTVITVMGGIALTGGWVALRLALAPLPRTRTDAALAWWVWRLTFWMFVSTGTPITVWQIWQARQRLAGLAAYLLRERHGHEADDGTALA